MNEIITIDIKFAGSTLLGSNNCFSLYDSDGKSHKIVNFYYETFKDWVEKTNQVDVKVRCIPKSTTIWEICDERIPSYLYRSEYCVVCTPLRMLPLKQRKTEMAKCRYKKVFDKNDKTKWWLTCVHSYSGEKISKGGIIIPNFV